MEEAGGLNAFVQTIPYNLYALLTIAMVLFLSATNFDFGPMKKAEERCLAEASPEPPEEREQPPVSEGDTAPAQGTVLDLVLPIVTLIITAILGMAYVGGFFEGVDFATAIGENPVAGLTQSRHICRTAGSPHHVPAPQADDHAAVCHWHY